MNSNKTVYAGWEATGVPDKLNGDDHYAYVIGYLDGNVRPNANVSRAETATIFFRLLKSDIRDGNLIADNGFSDVSDGQWHNKAISTMAKLGIVKGRRADNFDPDASITRADVCGNLCALQHQTGREQRQLLRHFRSLGGKRDRESGGVRLDFGLSGRHVPPRRPHHPR